jgi:dTDP-4-dehydrorhamnose 3,5-epimerase
MEIIQTPIPDLLVIQPRSFEDPRGFFLETFQAERYENTGIAGPFVQDNHSRSTAGVLRGLHFQKNHPQGKLVYVVRGAVYDLSVDLRTGSPTYGRWYGTTLSDENHRQMYVPPGFAHGFCVLSESVDFIYKCTDYYHPDDEGGLLWNDPDLAVEWPVESPILAPRDMGFPKLKELGPEDLPQVEYKGAS